MTCFLMSPIFSKLDRFITKAESIFNNETRYFNCPSAQLETKNAIIFSTGGTLTKNK